MPNVAGSFYNKSEGTTTIYTRINNGYKRITDTVGFRETDNPLSIDRKENEGLSLTGSRFNEDMELTHSWDNVPRELPVSFGFISTTDSVSNAKIKGFNITNPGRPEILLPVFLAELRDIPRMVRQLGDTLRWINNGIRRPPNTIASGLNTAKKVAADNLGYNFGWAPLYSDIMKMVMFQDAVRKRSQELSRLHSGKGLKRRITLEDRSDVQRNQSGTVWSTHGVVLTYPSSAITINRTLRRWMTIRYQPTSDSPLPDQDLAIRLMLTGITPGALASNLWEAIPWTWLLDYFTNLGDIVASTNNSAHVRVQSACLMTHLSWKARVSPTTWTFTSPNSGTVELSRGSFIRETKSRSVGMPTFSMPEIGLPLLSGKQLSILGSLAVMRIGK